MALRIGQGQAASKPAVMAETNAVGVLRPTKSVEEPEVVDVPVEDELEPRAEVAKVSPEVARYLIPEYRCGSCVHFLDGGTDVGSCEIVAGAIHPEGSCCLYEPDTESLSAEMPAGPEMMSAEETAVESDEEY